MNNIYTVKFAENVLESFKCNGEAIKFTRDLCHCEENAGKEFSIEKNGEQIFVGVCVKQSTGKMMLMEKSKFESAKKKSEELAEKREALTKAKADRQKAREERKIAAEKSAVQKTEVKANNARIKEIYVEIHNIHLDARKKKASFLKAFKTVQTKEREAVKALQEELEALMKNNQEVKMNLNTPEIDVQNVMEDVENIF